MISIQSLVQTVILVICLGLVFYLLHWLIGYVGLPQPFEKVARVILAIAAVLCLVAVLMSLAGFPLVRWGP